MLGIICFFMPKKSGCIDSHKARPWFKCLTTVPNVQWYACIGQITKLTKSYPPDSRVVDAQFS